MITFEVLGEPVAKGRPKFSTRGGFAKAYTPAATRHAEGNFQSQAVQYAPKQPLDGPLALIVRVYRSKGMPKTKKGLEAAERGAIRPITKPDGDNYLKLVCDSMNCIFWHDDAQVVDKSVSKYFSTRPRIEVELSEVINF